MEILKPVLELSKGCMDLVGVEIMDKIISYIPTVSNAIGNNDMATINRIMNATRKQFELLPPHITVLQLRKVATERIDGFKAVNACLNQGKCGMQAYIRFLFDCVSPLSTLMVSLLNV